MSHELYYTSASRGLAPHSRGFCTVARTREMPGAVVERLESLSSYQPIFAGGSQKAACNPVAFAHWRIPVGARSRSVLSRVAYVASDESGRPGKFAHHVLLDPAEQSAAGPAAMLMTPGVMRSQWIGEPAMLAPRALPPSIDPGAIEPSSAAWPARLAEAFDPDSPRPAYVIYPPNLDLLPLLNAAIHHLAPPQRWLATFCTHFTELPAGLSCIWRCVIAATPAAAAARAAKGLVIDLSDEAEGI